MPVLEFRRRLPSLSHLAASLPDTQFPWCNFPGINLTHPSCLSADWTI